MIDDKRPFSEYNINPAIIRGLEDSGIFRATDIQNSSIENISKSKSLIFYSPSGTGKTCAFSITMLELICQKYFSERNDQPVHVGSGHVLGLVLTPTPELSQQVAKEIQLISRHLPLNITTCVSSMNLENDWEDVSNANIMIATPGIITKLLRKKKLSLYHMLVLVIDEWDKMLGDEKLAEAIKLIIEKPHTNLSCSICSSATYNLNAYHKLKEFLPLNWTVLKSGFVSNGRKMFNLICRAGSFEKRVNILLKFLNSIQFYQALIFSNLFDVSEETCNILNSNGFPTMFISSQDLQNERLDTISEFRDLQYRCLVATDIGARGLDFSKVNVVVSLDLPHDDETFIHRIGRAGRFMTNGMSLTFYKRQESTRIGKIKSSCFISFDVLDLNNVPFIDLPLLDTEEQIQNHLKNLRIQNDSNSQIIGSENEKIIDESPVLEPEVPVPKFTVPILPWCTSRSDYWKKYHVHCNRYRIPD